jgi:hypothetical protein
MCCATQASRHRKQRVRINGHYRFLCNKPLSYFKFWLEYRFFYDVGLDFMVTITKTQFVSVFSYHHHRLDSPV